MPEGDSIANLARRMTPLLLGRRIESVDSRVAEVDEKLVHDATVVDIRAHGKNLLIDLSSGFTLHSHLLMRGRWRMRPLSQAGFLPHDTRLAIRTSEVEAFCTAQILRLVKTDRISRDPKLARLGPDPLHEGFQVSDVIQRMQGSPARELGDIVLDQAVMAGIGNVLKSEGLFLAGADPWARVDSYDDVQLHSVIQSLAKVLRDNSKPRLGLDRKGGRMTRLTDQSFRGTGSRLWVYNKSGEPCLVCGTRVQMKPQGEHVRSTYWCRRCQPPHAFPSDALTPPLRGKDEVR
jgi:endonuclease VIII